MKRYKQCILGTCCVPWDENFQFAEDIFRRSVRLLLDEGTKDLYLFGTAGEGYALDDGQFEQITKVFCEELAEKSADPMIGVISLSLRRVVRRIQAAYNMNVRRFQISLPSWGACTLEEAKCFFAETAGKFPDCQFLIYNISRTGHRLNADELAVIHDEFPNIVAVKMGAAGLQEVVELTKKSPEFQFFFTETSGFVTACLLGIEVGLLISLASANWKTAKKFYTSCLERDVEKISVYAKELVHIKDILLRNTPTSAHIDGAYDKFLSKLTDPEFPLRLLPPYSYASDENFENFRRELSSFAEFGCM